MCPRAWLSDSTTFAKKTNGTHGNFLQFPVVCPNHRYTNTTINHEKRKGLATCLFESTETSCPTYNANNPNFALVRLPLRTVHDGHLEKVSALTTVRLVLHRCIVPFWSLRTHGSRNRSAHVRTITRNTHPPAYPQTHPRKHPHTHMWHTGAEMQVHT